MLKKSGSAPTRPMEDTSNQSPIHTDCKNHSVTCERWWTRGEISILKKYYPPNIWYSSIINCVYCVFSHILYVRISRKWRNILKPICKGTLKVIPEWPQGTLIVTPGYPQSDSRVLSKWPQSDPQGTLKVTQDYPQSDLRVSPKWPQSTLKVT